MQNNSLQVSSFVKIANHKVFKNGELLFDSQLNTFLEFADEAYKHFEISYSKFHKMDALSKLGFLSAEVLLKHFDLKSKYPQEQIGIILSNNNASLDTDKKYVNLLKDGKASPAVFVYTLPNIVIGEISIRHGFKGENTFFLSSKYEIEQQVSYIKMLFDTNVLDVCIGGWVEFVDEHYECFMFLIENENSLVDNNFSLKNIQNWYNKN